MGVEGRAKVGQAGGHGGPPVLEAGKIVRVPLADLHEFLVANGLYIPGVLVEPGDPQRLVVELAPVTSSGVLRPGGACLETLKTRCFTGDLPQRTLSSRPVQHDICRSFLLGHMLPAAWGTQNDRMTG